MATDAPSAARRLAMEAPILRDPPVTRATLPASFLEFVFIRIGNLNHLFFCSEIYRQPGEVSIVFLFRENRGFAGKFYLTFIAAVQHWPPFSFQLIYSVGTELISIKVLSYQPLALPWFPAILHRVVAKVYIASFRTQTIAESNLPRAFHQRPPRVVRLQHALIAW
jgi:hypothetical protein